MKNIIAFLFFYFASNVPFLTLSASQWSDEFVIGRLYSNPDGNFTW